MPDNDALHTLNNPALSLQKLVKERPLVTGDEKILVLGASGQVAQFLVPELRKFYPDNLILTDLKANEEKGVQALDVTDAAAIEALVSGKNVKAIINLAALLSGASKTNPVLARKINVEAPKNILDIAERHDVRLVFTPSSIAVLNKIARKAAEIDKGHHEGGFGAPLDVSLSDTSGDYGLAKRDLEANSAAATLRSDHGLRAMCLRYGGVFTCQPVVSDGTTEQFDNLINEAAKFTVNKFFDPNYTQAEPYKPLIGPEATFPMLDGRTVATETMRFLHAEPEKIAANAHRYGLAEYSASTQQVVDEVRKLAPDFKVEFDPSKYDAAKQDFASSWPQQLDVSDSVRDWGMMQHYTLKESVHDHFNRLVTHYKEEKMAKRGYGTKTHPNFGAGIPR